MSPTTPRFPDDPMDYDLPPHSDLGVPAGVAKMPHGPAATCVRKSRS
jgi:hypothetical protein